MFFFDFKKDTAEYIDEFENALEAESSEYIDESSSVTFSSFSNASVIPMDVSTEMIVSWNNSNKLCLSPDFQRRDVWENKRMSLFIESLILNIPIPSILLAQDTQKNKLIVIDGKQRLNAILAFWAPQKNGAGIRLSGLEVLKELNGYTYKKLKEDSSKIDLLSRFEGAILKANILKNYDEDLLYFIFSRLNSGSVPLSTQELRQAMYPGEFVKFANDFSIKSNEIKKVLKLKNPDKRMRDVELVIRYFAFKYFRDIYANSINKFFNYTCAELNKKWDTLNKKIIKDGDELTTAIQFVYSYFGTDAFCAYFIDEEKEYFGPFNRPMFDLMTVVFSEEKYRNIVDSKNLNLKDFIIDLFRKNSRFADGFMPTTHSLEKTRARFEEFINAIDAL